MGETIAHLIILRLTPCLMTSKRLSTSRHSALLTSVGFSFQTLFAGYGVTVRVPFMLGWITQ